MTYKRKIALEVDVYKLPDEMKSLVHVCGVYFLIKNGEIDYIGKSTNICNRLTSHHVYDRKAHKEIWVYPVDYKLNYKLHQIEYELIRNLRPPGNTHGIRHHG